MQRVLDAGAIPLELFLTVLAHEVGVTSAEILLDAGAPPVRLRAMVARGGR